MFASKGKYSPAGLFSIGHLILAIITIALITITVYKTKNLNRAQVKKLIKIFAIVFVILEVIKIIYSLTQNSIYDINTYLPLYYCSAFMYALILARFCKGKFQKAGEVFLATGCFVGGVIFILFPSTSLTTYPIFHFVSIHSFIYHGAMVYVSILLNITNYVSYTYKDIIYYINLLLPMFILACILNNKFNSNLMFISQDFDNVVIHFIYTKANSVFSLLMALAQLILPFEFCIGLKELLKQNVETLELKNES